MRAGLDGRAAGGAIAVLSAGTFGSSGVFASALISTGWSPAATAIARLGVAAVLLTVPAVLQLRGRWGLLRRSAGTVLSYGLVAIAGGQLCYFNAIESIPVGLATMLEYLGVVIIVGWLWVSRGQRPRWPTMTGVAAALAGLALLAGLATSARLSPAGIIWGLLDAVCLAVYYLLSAADREQPLPPLALAWGGLVTGTVVLALAGAAGAVPLAAHAGDVGLLHHQVSWIVPVLELSLVSTAVAFIAGISAARRLGAKLASFIGLAEVAFAVVYAWLLLGQVPAGTEFAGGVLMLAGVILVRADETRAGQPATPRATAVLDGGPADPTPDSKTADSERGTGQCAPWGSGGSAPG
jgi:drug/metabolite transporter (DMT)-like permease